MDLRTTLTLLSLLSLSLSSPQSAEDCRVYHLLNGTERHTAPSIPFRGRLEVSLWTGPSGLAPKSLVIYLDADDDDDDVVSRSVQVYVTSESKVVLRVAERKAGGPLALGPPVARTWINLVLALHQGTLLVYRPEDRINVLTAAVPLEGKVTASVHCRHEVHVAFNCAAGCMVHDGSSPLVGTSLGPGSSLGFYATPLGQDLPRTFLLSPRGREAGARDVLGDTASWEAGKWYRLRLSLRQDGAVGGEDVAYSLANVTGVLWTFHCYPETAEGAAGDADPTTTPTPQEEEDEDEEAPPGAGAGEVVAWVLAGLALFVVALLALALCTRMAPPQDRPPDFLPSVGVLSQRCDAREAEEGSEPGSPMLTVPPVGHGRPNNKGL